MTTDTAPAAAPRTYPADEWVRSVTFQDNAVDTGDDAPVHVGQRVLINGAPSPLRINLREPWSVTNAGQDGTIVSFLIHPDDATIHRIADDGTTEAHAAIGGHKVMTPVDYRWTTEHTVKPINGPLPGSTYTDPTPVWEWLRVYFFAREVNITSRMV